MADHFVKQIGNEWAVFRKDAQGRNEGVDTFDNEGAARAAANILNAQGQAPTPPQTTVRPRTTSAPPQPAPTTPAPAPTPPQTTPTTLQEQLDAHAGAAPEQTELQRLNEEIARREAVDPEHGSAMHRKLEQLRVQRDKLVVSGGAGNEAEEATKQGYRERHQAAIQKRAGVVIESRTIGSPEHLEALRQELALEKQLEEQQERLKQARAVAKGETPQQQLQEQLLGRLGPRVPGTANALLHAAQGLQSSPGISAAGEIRQLGSAVSGMLAPFPLAATAVSGVTSVVGMLVQELDRWKWGMEQLRAEAERTSSMLDRSRRTGLPTGRDIQQSLTAQEAGELAEAQRTNDRGRQLRVLRRAEERLAPLAAREEQEAPQTAQAGQVLRRRLESGFYANMGRGFVRRELAELFPNANANPDIIPVGRLPTPGEVDNIVNTLVVQGGTRQRGALASIQAAQGQGGAAIPSILPGGLSLNDLPSLFQSRQSDVLSIHDQIQQEAVKDMKQDQQYQAQMTLWTQILNAIQGQPPPPVPAAPVGA